MRKKARKETREPVKKLPPAELDISKKMGGAGLQMWKFLFHL
jgi:hypothetical protein